MPQLFVGTMPPDDVEAVLADYPRADITGVRWATPGHWIVALREVGDVSNDTARIIAGALRAALSRMPAAQAVLGTVHREAGIVIDVDGLAAHTDAVFDATTRIVSSPSSVTRQARIVMARGRLPKELVRPVPALGWRVGEIVLATASRTKDSGFEIVESFSLT